MIERQPSFSTIYKSTSSPAISYFIFSFSVICSRSIFFCLAIFSALLFSAFLLYPECRHFFPALYLLLSNGYSQSASLLAHSRRAASQLIFSSLLSKFPPPEGRDLLSAATKKPRFLKYGPVSHSVFSKSEVLFFISILCSYLLTPASLRARF